MEKDNWKSQSPQIGSMFLTYSGLYFNSLYSKPSQSPQIGSMFLTSHFDALVEEMKKRGRNPLKSGQCFLPGSITPAFFCSCVTCRNPLKSGQCFLPNWIRRRKNKKNTSQSPQIGSMFLTSSVDKERLNGKTQLSQSPQIGSMFLTCELGLWKG